MIRYLQFEQLEHMMRMEYNYPAGKSGHIIIIDGLIDDSLCDKFISATMPIWDLISHDGETIGGVQTLTKSSRDMGLSERSFQKKNVPWSKEWEELENGFLAGIHTAVSFYITEFVQLQIWESIRDTGFQVQRYPKNNGYYRYHIDSFPSLYGECNRVLACILYLNDVEFGGETNFPLHEVMVKPKKGRIVLFPATWTHPHESRPAHSSDKWIISTFVVNGENENDHNHHDNEIRDENGNVLTRPMAKHISIVNGDIMNDALTTYIHEHNHHVHEHHSSDDWQPAKID